MAAFDEYYDIEAFPPGFLDEVKEFVKACKAKFPRWEGGIDIVNNAWPLKNALKLNYGNLTLLQLSEIDTDLHRLFQKHNISFEVTSSGFSAEEE